MPDDFNLSFQETCKEIDVGESILSKMIKDGKIRAQKKHRRWQISKSSVEDYLYMRKASRIKSKPESKIDKIAALRFIGTTKRYKKLDVSDRVYRRVNFRRLPLNRLNFLKSFFYDCDFLKTNFQKSRLSRCVFRRCTFHNSLLGASNLSKSHFYKCKFNNTKFRLKKNEVPENRFYKFLYNLTTGKKNECITEETLFEHCEFHNCDLRYIIELEDWCFRESKFLDGVLLPENIKMDVLV